MTELLPWARRLVARWRADRLRGMSLGIRRLQLECDRVMNADGSGAVRLAAASGFASPTWSSDGQVIAYGWSNVIE